jgi:DUF1680 family protein
MTTAWKTAWRILLPMGAMTFTPSATPTAAPQRTQVQPVVMNAVTDAFVPADYAASDYEGYLGNRMAINLEKRLLSLNLDTLLGPFKQRSGGQWWLGEHAGKFLHAATHAWRFTGDQRLKERLDDTVDELIAAQLPNGYLGTYPEADRFVERDGISWDGPVWDVWTHKYCLIGLLTYYQATSHKPALEASRRAADLLCDTFGPGKKSIVLASSHVGMASTSVLEPMAVLYRFTGEQRYLAFCHHIIRAWQDPPEPRLLRSLLDHGNVFRTANNKAYEMMSNLVGLMELYRIDGDQRYLEACRKAWDDIHTRRLYAIGTTSYAEHFTDDWVLPTEARPGDREPKIGEGCATVTWLQLTMHLFQVTGAPKYASAIERTIYNALPAAQSPHTGQVCYFLPQNGHRRFGEVSHGLQPDISCCSSSLPRGMALMPEWVSGALHGDPAVIQYEAGTHAINAVVGNRPVRIELQIATDYPKSGDIRISVRPPQPLSFPFLLRVPVWSESFVASVGGARYEGTAGTMLRIERTWTPGDTMSISVSMPLQLRKDPDQGSNKVWFMRGPQVLAWDHEVSQTQGLRPDWWGSQIYSVSGKRDGRPVRLGLVPFAEAGQNKRPYSVMLEDLEVDTSARIVRITR